jgi:hypothetical protein
MQCPGAPAVPLAAAAAGLPSEPAAARSLLVLRGAEPTDPMMAPWDLSPSFALEHVSAARDSERRFRLESSRSSEIHTKAAMERGGNPHPFGHDPEACRLSA